LRAQDAPAAPESWDARLTAVTGEVVVHPADGGEESSAEIGMPLEQGDRIVTSPGAEAEIALDGGSLITLRENSDFTLEKTAKSESVFALALGSMLAKIQKLGTQRLQIRTPSSVAAVRGTEFGVEVEGEQSHVGVFDEGRVEVSGSGATQVLTPNQETSVAKGQPPRKAAPLKRFVVHRARMQAQLRRLRTVRRNWKKQAPAQRRAHRKQVLERMRELRRNARAQREKMQKIRANHPNLDRKNKRPRRKRPLKKAQKKAPNGERQ
jgi:hypothetical protein